MSVLCLQWISRVQTIDNNDFWVQSRVTHVLRVWLLDDNIHTRSHDFYSNMIDYNMGSSFTESIYGYWYHLNSISNIRILEYCIHTLCTWNGDLQWNPLTKPSKHVQIQMKTIGAGRLREFEIVNRWKIVGEVSIWSYFWPWFSHRAGSYIKRYLEKVLVSSMIFRSVGCCVLEQWLFKAENLITYKRMCPLM